MSKHQNIENSISPHRQNNPLGCLIARDWEFFFWGGKRANLEGGLWLQHEEMLRFTGQEGRGIAGDPIVMTGSVEWRDGVAALSTG